MNPPTPDHPAPSEESRWFIEQVLPHEPSLRSYLKGRFRAGHEVDDVVQESYLRLWKARALQPIKSAKAFLFKVARNIAIDLIRRDSISPLDAVTDIAALSVLEDRPGVADAASTHDEAALLVAAIDTLPPRCREIVILRKLRGVPQKAIACQLGISEQTVQVQVLRGVKRIEKHLARSMDAR